MGTPQLSTHAGLTPQMSIVDANGRPTMFFFRWLLTIGGAALTADDLSILESFDPGADAALAEGRDRGRARSPRRPRRGFRGRRRGACGFDRAPRRLALAGAMRSVGGLDAGRTRTSGRLRRL